jgi:putative thymidine phosphorylase
MDEKAAVVESIQKKLSGKQLTYKEILAIMDEIAHKRLGDVLTTYFAASGYSRGFSDEELYYLTKAMVETGERLHFPGIVADKHSIGGVPGTRTTIIVVPIIAAAGFTIPKNSSRAITTPGGTADDMEVIAPVTFTKDKIYQIVKKTKGCIVWGGGVDIAPADDELIKVEEPLMFESIDKILVSIMAKKVAFGSNHVVIDLPYGKHVKVASLEAAVTLKEKFEKLAARFGIKIRIRIHKTNEPAGRGVGPLLEAREALKVLEQTPDRPLDLEQRSLALASELLDLCLEDADKEIHKSFKVKFNTPDKWGKYLLSSGLALAKMRDIIHAQGGNPNVTSHNLHPGEITHKVSAEKKGIVTKLNSKNISIIAKILGCPHEKKAGLYLHKKIGETFNKGESLFTLYATDTPHIKEALDSLSIFPILEHE